MRYAGKRILRRVVFDWQKRIVSVMVARRYTVVVSISLVLLVYTAFRSSKGRAYMLGMLCMIRGRSTAFYNAGIAGRGN
jgi:hypothetical protein